MITMDVPENLIDVPAWGVPTAKDGGSLWFEHGDYLRSDVREWLKDNLTCRFATKVEQTVCRVGAAAHVTHKGRIGFSDEIDATLFMLRWL